MLQLLSNQRHNQKGFTLIELMIVVAIIGILAAIAIPQFSTYRMKAFNSAALSDLHSVKLAQEALYADYQGYGGSAKSGDSGTSAGVVLTSVDTGAVATGTANNEVLISISKSVEIQVAVDNKDGGVYYTATAQHKQGNRIFAAEGDQGSLWYKDVAPATAFSPVTATTNAADAKADGYTEM